MYSRNILSQVIWGPYKVMRAGNSFYKMLTPKTVPEMQQGVITIYLMSDLKQ